MRIITFLILLVSFIILFYKLKNNDVTISDIIKNLSIQLKEAINLSNYNIKAKSFEKLRRVILIITIALFLIMLLSSFLPSAFTNDKLSGLFLIVHTIFAPLFALALASVLFLYSYKLKLGYNDFRNIGSLKKGSESAKNTIIKFSFWLLVVISIPLLFSIILILYPILGTEFQNIFIIMHRISALIFTILLIVLLFYSLLLK